MRATGIGSASKPVMKSFAPQFSALMTTLRPAGPVISTGDRPGLGPAASGPAARPPVRPGIRAARPGQLGVGDRGTRAAPRGVTRTSRPAPPASRAPRRPAPARRRLARARWPRRRERSGHCSCDTRLRPAYGSRRSGGILRQLPSRGTGKRSPRSRPD
jgi:hypothetical protein